MSVYQVHLDDVAQTQLDQIKNDYAAPTDRAGFDLAISLAAQLSEHIDTGGYIRVLNGATVVAIKVRGVTVA
jgi:hypothetical protein